MPTGTLSRLESAPRPEEVGPHPFPERMEVWFYHPPEKGRVFYFVWGTHTDCRTSRILHIKVTKEGWYHFRTRNSTYTLEGIKYVS